MTTEDIAALDRLFEYCRSKDTHWDIMGHCHKRFSVDIGYSYGHGYAETITEAVAKSIESADEHLKLLEEMA